MHRWLHFRLHAPLVAFGGESIDAYGVTRDFPGQSMLTGLFANALGWMRTMREEHQALQDRIVYGALLEQEDESSRLRDYQTARLAKDDRAWTTRGTPAVREGGPDSYSGSHQRWRDYHADLRTSGVVRLDPEDASPTLDDLAEALERPARPLFIGRKPCLPSASIFAGWVEAPNARDALRSIMPEDRDEVRALWPTSEGEEGAYRTTSVTDERNWMTGLHGGARSVCEGSLRK